MYGVTALSEELRVGLFFDWGINEGKECKYQRGSKHHRADYPVENVIRQKRIKVEKLEQKRQKLLEEQAEIELRIQAATSEETIRRYAEQEGMTQISGK